MFTCHLPPNTNVVRFSDISILIADAIHKNRDLHEWQRCKYWANQELIDLARNGSIKLRNPDTHGKLDIDPGTRDLEGVLSYTVMTLDDLKLLMADRHIEVSTGEEFQKLVEELAFEKLESALGTALASQADQEAPAHAATPATDPPMNAPAGTTASEPDTPTDTVVAASDTPAQSVKKSPKWLIQNIDYIARINSSQQCSSAQSLFNKLEGLGESDNIVVKKGTSTDRGKLYFVNVCKAISFATFRKFMPEIKAHVLS
jgi:hypothetical protein